MRSLIKPCWLIAALLPAHFALGQSDWTDLFNCRNLDGWITTTILTDRHTTHPSGLHPLQQGHAGCRAFLSGVFFVAHFPLG